MEEVVSTPAAEKSARLSITQCADPAKDMPGGPEDETAISFCRAAPELGLADCEY